MKGLFKWPGGVYNKHRFRKKVVLWGGPIVSVVSQRLFKPGSSLGEIKRSIATLEWLPYKGTHREGIRYRIKPQCCQRGAPTPPTTMDKGGAPTPRTMKERYPRPGDKEAPIDNTLGENPLIATDPLWRTPLNAPHSILPACFPLHPCPHLQKKKDWPHQAITPYGKGKEGYDWKVFFILWFGFRVCWPVRSGQRGLY